MNSAWKKRLQRTLLILILIASAVGSGFISMRYASRRQIINLPSLIGLKYQEAYSLAASLGLRIEITKMSTSSGIPPRTVLSQHPAGGTPLKSGQTVQVILSTEKEPPHLPAILGTSFRMAQMMLNQSGYRIGQVCNSRLGVENASTIVSFRKTLPSEQDLSEKVDLLVNDGPEESYFLMPDLRGKDINSVMHLFDHHGITIKDIRYRSVPDCRKGIIIGQQPPSGSRLSIQDLILLEASS